MFICEFSSSQLVFIWFVLSGVCDLVSGVIYLSILLEVSVFIVYSAAILVLARSMIERVAGFGKEVTKYKKIHR